MRANFAKTIIVETYRTAAANAFELVRAMWLPVVLGGASLYFALDLYFSLLQQFLVAPSPRASSLALATAAAGIMTWLLFHAVAAMMAIRAGLNHPRRQWFRLRIRRAELRLFAGILRFIGILAVWGTFILGAWDIGEGFMGPVTRPVAAVAFFAGSVVLWVRFAFMMPAVVAAERVRVLRRCWTLTQGLLLPLVAIWLLVSMPPLFLMEAVGDLLLKSGLWTGPLQAGMGPDLDANTLAGFKSMLPGAILTFTISNAVSLALTVTASVAAYRRLTHDAG